MVTLFLCIARLTRRTLRHTLADSRPMRRPPTAYRKRNHWAIVTVRKAFVKIFAKYAELVHDGLGSIPASQSFCGLHISLQVQQNSSLCTWELSSPGIPLSASSQQSHTNKY